MMVLVVVVTVSWRGFMVTVAADKSYTNFTPKQNMTINQVLKTTSSVTNESTRAADKSLCHLIVRGR